MHVFKAALITAALTVSGGAMAQNFQIGPDGIRVDRDRQERTMRGDREMRGEISQREAVNIARRQGVADVERVRTSRGAYTIDGTDRRGDDILVRVSFSGEVLDVRRD